MSAGASANSSAGAQQRGVVEVGSPVHLDGAAVVGVESQLQRRQCRACREPGVAERGEHVAEVFVVGGAE